MNHHRNPFAIQSLRAPDLINAEVEGTRGLVVQTRDVMRVVKTGTNANRCEIIQEYKKFNIKT